MTDAATDTLTSGLAAPRSGPAPPRETGVALAAETERFFSHRPARTLTTPVLSECGEEIRMLHRNPLPLIAIRLVRIGGNALYRQNAAGDQDAVTTRQDI